MAERLADAPIQAFLATRPVVVLATLQPDGAPLAAAMWVLAGPDRLTMISVADTQKVRNITRDPRVSVVAEAGTDADIRGVTVQGRAELLEDSPGRSALVERFVARYPGVERRWRGRALPADRVMFQVVPEKVWSWGLPA
jgi:PPOX class probable F420-dependent enzyme